MNINTVCVVGLGLIGGSLAKSIKARTGHTVYGIDLDGETMVPEWAAVFLIGRKMADIGFESEVREQPKLF